MTPSGTAHIWLDERGRGWIDDTNTKVIEVVLDKLAYGDTPEKMHEEHSHLSLAQIHAALSYYYDPKAEYDAESERQTKCVDEMMAQAANSPRRQRLMRLKEKRARDPQTLP